MPAEPSQGAAVLSADGVTMRTRTIDGRKAIMVDGLFEQGAVDLAYLYFKALPCRLSDYDTPETKHVLHWKCEFDVAKPPDLVFISQIWSRIVETMGELFGDRGLSLRRAHLNTSLYGDFQSPHRDPKDSVTALYFANTEWRPDWIGEIVFYDDAGEAVYAVAPKPGRVLFFDGNIKHRAGVPSRTCFEPRLTVAFKFVDEQAG